MKHSCCPVQPGGKQASVRVEEAERVHVHSHPLSPVPALDLPDPSRRKPVCAFSQRASRLSRVLQQPGLTAVCAPRLAWAAARNSFLLSPSQCVCAPVVRP